MTNLIHSSKKSGLISFTVFFRNPSAYMPFRTEMSKVVLVLNGLTKWLENFRVSYHLFFHLSFL